MKKKWKVWKKEQKKKIGGGRGREVEFYQGTQKNLYQRKVIYLIR